MTVRIVPVLRPGHNYILYGDPCHYLGTVLGNDGPVYVVEYRGSLVNIARIDLLKMIDEGDLYPAPGQPGPDRAA